MILKTISILIGKQLAIHWKTLCKFTHIQWKWKIFVILAAISMSACRADDCNFHFCWILAPDTDKLMKSCPPSGYLILYNLQCYLTVESSVIWQQRARVICQPQSSDNPALEMNILSPLSEWLSTKKWSWRRKIEDEKIVIHTKLTEKPISQ